MRSLLLLSFLFGFLFNSAQKKSLDYDAISNWPLISPHPIISNDGKYIAYLVKSTELGSRLVVQSIDNIWQRVIPDFNGTVFFTENSGQLIFSNPSKDSIGVIDLNSNIIRYISDAYDFFLQKCGSGQWLIYKNRAVSKSLVLHDLFRGTESNYSGVQDYLMSDNGEVLFLAISNPEKNANYVVKLNTRSKINDTICTNCLATDLRFNEKTSALAFLTRTFDKSEIISVRYYKPGMDSAKMIVDSNSAVMNKMKFEGIGLFSNSGDKLFFLVSAREKADFKADVNQAKLRLWHYNDAFYRKWRNLAIGLRLFFFRNQKAAIIQQTDDIRFDPDYSSDAGFALAVKYNVSEDDYRPDVFLVSVENSLRRRLLHGVAFQELRFSPGGKYISWFDLDKKHWYAHNIALGSTKEITTKLNPPFKNLEVRQGSQVLRDYWAGW